MSELYRMQQRWPEAISYAERAVQKSASPDNLAQLGLVYASTGKPRAKVEDAYRRAGVAQADELVNRPTDGPSWMLLALCRAQTGQMDEARDLIKKAEQFHALDVDSQLTKVRVLELAGERQECLDALADCMKRAPIRLQLDAMPELAALRGTPEYQQIVGRA
jgi:tetratricopeptide (TPR) repeat protein